MVLSVVNTIRTANWPNYWTHLQNADVKLCKCEVVVKTSQPWDLVQFVRTQRFTSKNTFRWTESVNYVIRASEPHIGSRSPPGF